MPRLRLLPPAIEAKTPRECAPILNALLKRGGTIAIDTETTGLDRMRDRVLFWSIATEDSRWCLPVNMLPFFEPLFRRPDVVWALANAKYDMHLLKNMGIDLVGQCEDVFIQDHLLDDTRRHGLKEQSWFHYEAKWGDFKQLFLDPVVVSQVLGMDKDMARKFKAMGVGDKLLHVYNQEPHMVVEYASCDAYFTYMLWEQHNAALGAEELATEVVPGFTTLLDYFQVIEAPLTRTLFKMERRGANIDQDHLKKIDEPMRDGIRALEKELCDRAGRKFNANSHPQVREVIYDERKGFGLKPARFTKGQKGALASTDEKSIEILLGRLDPQHSAAGFLRKLQEHRKLAKLHKTYVKGILKHIGPDGKIHTSFKQSVVRTGRFSSGDPNLQNIPRPGTDPYKIRGAFIPSEGMWLVDKDYPQIEFRVAAVNAGDTRMIDAIHKGWDIHNANTANMFGLSYDAISAAKAKHKDDLTQEDMRLLIKRQESKAVGLGTLFGEGARKIAIDLGIDINSAHRLKAKFSDTYPDISNEIAFMHEYAHVFGYSYTALGRKRRHHRIESDLGWAVAEEERQAYNHSVQGSAAELMKLAMLMIDNDPIFEELGSYLTLTVHDELIMESPKATANDTSDLMHDHMADPLRWGPFDMAYPVPIPPDGDIGYRWSDCH